ncbi:hypothetical protein FIBSPDRAFT_979068, partial [Athelia psychrophila]
LVCNQFISDNQKASDSKVVPVCLFGTVKSRDIASLHCAAPLHQNSALRVATETSPSPKRNSSSQIPNSCCGFTSARQLICHSAIDIDTVNKAILNDPNTYLDPSVFNPERFLTDGRLIPMFKILNWRYSAMAEEYALEGRLPVPSFGSLLAPS